MNERDLDLCVKGVLGQLLLSLNLPITQENAQKAMKASSEIMDVIKRNFDLKAKTELNG
jgi:hypothetical protein